jgi:hypothetical protein
MIVSPTRLGCWSIRCGCLQRCLESDSLPAVTAVLVAANVGDSIGVQERRHERRPSPHSVGGLLSHRFVRDVVSLLCESVLLIILETQNKKTPVLI